MAHDTPRPRYVADDSISLLQETRLRIPTETLVDGETDLNAKKEPEVTPLLEVCKRKVGYNPHVVKILLDEGADVSVRDVDGRTPLHYVVGTRDDPRGTRVGTVRLLAEHQADINARDKNGVTPLLRAAMTLDVLDDHGTIEALVDLGADVNAQDDFGNTTLLAVLSRYRGRFHDEDNALQDIVCLLVRRGANVCVATNTGSTPLHMAAQFRLSSVVALLVKHQAEINASDRDGDTPLHLGLRGSNWYGESLKWFVRFLLENNADVNKKNKCGDTPLHEAVANYQWCMDEIVQLLMDYGADLFVANDKGHTVLHSVAATGAEFVAILLINHFADVNVKDNDGNTPLHLACSRYYNPGFMRSDMVKFLLDHQANVNARNDLGDTPLHVVTFNSNQEEEKGSDIVELLVSRRADAFAANKYGDMPLFDFMKKGKWKSVRIILNHCTSSVDVKDRLGDTPLSIVVWEGHADFVSLLVERGADMNIMDSYNESPFLTACEVGTIDIIYRLIRFSPHHLRPQLRQRQVSS